MKHSKIIRAIAKTHRNYTDLFSGQRSTAGVSVSLRRLSFWDPSPARQSCLSWRPGPGWTETWSEQIPAISCGNISHQVRVWFANRRQKQKRQPGGQLDSKDCPSTWLDNNSRDSDTEVWKHQTWQQNIT